MKNSKTGGIAIIAILVVLVLVLVGQYNGMISAQEKVDGAYADIQTQLQRRADLIPNLVSTVKGYMEHEQSVIDSVTESREKLMNAGTVAEASEANEQLTSALNNLLVVVENYPDLKSNENFIQLQDELAGTENRIATSRRDYNDAVRSYNLKIKRFPGAILAGMFGFDAAEYFEASEGSEAVPEVNF